jgi:hypothetical protein
MIGDLQRVLDVRNFQIASNLVAQVEIGSKLLAATAGSWQRARARRRSRLKGAVRLPQSRP